jgi:guanylate kinase
MLVVVSGPSGSGKDTVIAEVLRQTEENVRLAISLTTRKPRPFEIHGTHYYFCEPTEFEEKIAAGEVLEYATYNGHYYGTPKSEVDRRLQEGQTVLLNIEVQGAARVKKLYPDCVRVFLLPPSLQVLKERILRRGGESEESVRCRLAIAKEEVKRAESYDYLLVNDTLESAVNGLSAILQAEQQRVLRCKDLLDALLDADT